MPNKKNKAHTGSQYFDPDEIADEFDDEYFDHLIGEKEKEDCNIKKSFASKLDEIEERAATYEHPHPTSSVFEVEDDDGRDD